MRKTLANYIEEDEYLLHADMFNTTKFPTKAKVIDCGLGEANLINIAAGISSQGKTVYIYGVAGFIIHHIQQLKLSLKELCNSKVIICNAGKFGYENMGIGHDISDDKLIMKMLNIPFYSPKNSIEFKNILDSLDYGINYIQLGADE